MNLKKIAERLERDLEWNENGLPYEVRNAEDLVQLIKELKTWGNVKT